MQQLPETIYDKEYFDTLDDDDIDANKIVVDTEPLPAVTQPPSAAAEAEAEAAVAVNDVTAMSGTITPKPPNVRLDDIFISVKTTKANHGNRLDVISRTWFQLASKQVTILLVSFFLFAFDVLICDII